MLITEVDVRRLAARLRIRAEAHATNYKRNKNVTAAMIFYEVAEELEVLCDYVVDRKLGRLNWSNWRSAFEQDPIRNR